MSGKEANRSGSGSGSGGYETSKSNLSGGSVPNTSGAPVQNQQLRDPNEIEVETQPLELGELDDGKGLNYFVQLCALHN